MRTIAIVSAALVLTITTVDAQRSRKTFPRIHPDPAFLCTETEKSTLHPDKYFIFKNVYEGIDIDNNTVRDVPKATDGDDLIMSMENTAEHNIEERFNKRTLYHKQTVVRKIPWQPNPRFPAEPPYTRTIEGPCEGLPDGNCHGLLARCNTRSASLREAQAIVIPAHAASAPLTWTRAARVRHKHNES